MRRDERGAVVPMVAIMLTVLMISAAFAVDLGKQRVVRQDMQALADVVAALTREGVIEGAPTSKKAMRAIQTAFDIWHAESGRPMMQISKVLALTVGPTAEA